METESLNDLLDRLVGEYSDRLARGEPAAPEELLAQVPEQHRAVLQRSLRMLEAGRAATPRATRPLAAGDRLDGFVLERELGRGGMATVWLARQEELRRSVAVKVLRPALALEQRHVDRFRREALAVARLSHPNVVQVLAVGETEGHHWIAMEHVQGVTLAQVLAALPARRPWSARDLVEASGISALRGRGETYEACVAALLAEVARGLAAAHEIGVVHRDVKPSNILVRTDGRAVVADFGLAKGDADPALSLTGDQVGTPWYMSPEQAHTIEAAVDHRTDVYSLGVTLYEALSGRRPFEGRTALAVLEAIKSSAPPPLASVSKETTRDGAAVCRRAMARLPERRYGSASELAEDLARLAAGGGTEARRLEGGPLRRAFAALGGGAAAGEYRSARTLLGLPLVHVYLGPRRPGQRVRVAKGWLAVGDVALGGVAFGGAAVGLCAWGGAAVGLLLAFGGIALGGAVCGGMAAGAYAFGGLSLGYLAFGGFARGHYAIGGYAHGTYATGGHPVGAPLDFGPDGPLGQEWFYPAAVWVAEVGRSLLERFVGPL